HSPGKSMPRREPESDRRRDPAGIVRRAVPLLRARAHAESNRQIQERRGPAGCAGAGAMTRDAAAALARAGFSRRDFLKTSGAIIVSFAATDTAAFGDAAPSMQGRGAAPGPFDTRASHVDPAQVDSWIAVAADGTVTAYTGKCEFGQGILTVQAQLVAEELSV